MKLNINVVRKNASGNLLKKQAWKSKLFIAEVPRAVVNSDL